jgi:hypothetical protein
MSMNNNIDQGVETHKSERVNEDLNEKFEEVKMMAEKGGYDHLNDILEKILEDAVARSPPDGTSTILVEDLTALLPTTKHHAVVLKIIEKAKALEYDDMHSPHTAPKFNLVDDLKEAELQNIIDKVVGGFYD